jgi:hypothetical protein
LLLDDRPNLDRLVAMQEGRLTWSEVIADSTAGAFGRPVAMGSFILNWVTSGPDVWALKATNLMLHLLCGVLVFWLSAALLRQPVVCMARHRWWLALWITAMWLLAPLFVSTVLYVVQRMAQLATLFTLVGLLGYVLGRQRLAEHRRLGISFITVCFAFCWPLAVLSKENGILLPLLVLIVELFFFADVGPERERRRLRWVLSALVAAPVLVIALKVLVDPAWLTGLYTAREYSLSERLLSESRILFDYLANLLLLPGGSPMGVYHDDYVISTAPTRPLSTLLCLVAWLSILIVGVYKAGTRIGLVYFGLVFFLAAHVVESSVIPLELYFEHRNYLPSVGIFLSLGLGVFFAYERVRFKTLLVLVVLALPVSFLVATFSRVQVWRSWEGIVFAAEVAHPNAPRVHTALASIYINRRDMPMVVEHLRRARALYAGRYDAATAIHRLAAYCVVTGPAPEEAYAWLEALTVIPDDKYTVNSLAWLVTAVQTHGCEGLDVERMVTQLQSLLVEGKSENAWRLEWRLYFETARLLALLDRKREAVDLLTSVPPRHDQATSRLLAARYLLDLGDHAGARRILDSLQARDDRLTDYQVQLLETFELQISSGTPDAGGLRGRPDAVSH